MHVHTIIHKHALVEAWLLTRAKKYAWPCPCVLRSFLCLVWFSCSCGTPRVSCPLCCSLCVLCGQLFGPTFPPLLAGQHISRHVTSVVCWGAVCGVVVVCSRVCSFSLSSWATPMSVSAFNPCHMLDYASRVLVPEQGPMLTLTQLKLLVRHCRNGPQIASFGAVILRKMKRVFH